MKILIVDDQELVFQSLEKFLIDHGYDFTNVYTVTDVVKILNTSKPNPITTDTNIPAEATKNQSKKEDKTFKKRK
ncbi:response regulator [Flavobacterium sp. 5]|uniref:response regulator n=1 Tax=Flavobacterium sp. 5 TaxID=2035199 RepID=UPI000CB774CE|nr:response regulator [Flavobacterium sp. 5]PKB15919.1 response regulator receiver domain-containing protein [Flavobacterium sp. 5]